MAKKLFYHQFDGVVEKNESFVDCETPVVSGQALTGEELFRRQSAGLPVGCAIRQFDKINPFLEKFRIYDNLNAFRLRHGMVDSNELVQSDLKEPVEPQPETQV